MPALLASGLDWDAGNLEKCQKHGVSIAEIEAVLRGDPQIAPAPRRSLTEERVIAVGRTSEGRPVFIAFTFRMRDGARLVRPISARYMHAKEIERYEATRS
ncbi:MAG TPA: BrnT family toxin [Stellaceae bacterium]